MPNQGQPEPSVQAAFIWENSSDIPSFRRQNPTFAHRLWMKGKPSSTVSHGQLRGGSLESKASQSPWSLVQMAGINKASPTMCSTQSPGWMRNTCFLSVLDLFGFSPAWISLYSGFCNNIVFNTVLWVGASQQVNFYPATFTLLSGTREKRGRAKARELMGQDEDRVITHLILPWDRQSAN